MVLSMPPPPTQVQHLLIHFHLVELYYHTGVWEFQVQPITFSIFRMGPAFHQLATCSAHSCDHRLRQKPRCSLTSSSSHFRSSGCQQTGTHSSHHVLRRSPSHPSQMVKVRYREEEPFSKGQTEVAEEPWGRGTLPQLPCFHLSSPFDFLDQRDNHRAQGRRVTELDDNGQH